MFELFEFLRTWYLFNIILISIYKIIEMHETIQHNNFDLTKSPLKSLCDMFTNYAKTTHGIMLGRSFNQTDIITERSNVRFKEEFFFFPSSRIYLMVNTHNMNFIYENYAHDARNKTSSLKDHFTISFVGFNSTQASYPDKYMLGKDTERIKGVRGKFKQQMEKPIKTFFKDELGENLFREILKKDCFICLSPIATLFPESKNLEVKVPPSGELLGFNKGGFIIPQSIAKLEEGNSV